MGGVFAVALLEMVGDEVADGGGGIDLALRLSLREGLPFSGLGIISGAG